MRASILLFAVCAACVRPTPELDRLLVFEGNAEAMAAASAAAEQCQISPKVICTFSECKRIDPQCAPKDVPFDREACAEFDKAVRVAVAPLSVCSDQNALDEDELLKQRCDVFLDDFNHNSCVGPYAYRMAERDWAGSQAYRQAVENSMSEEQAAELYLSEVVRYREFAPDQN
jgi:hypothetical protein